MKLASPLFRSVLEIKEGGISSLVIENQQCFRALMTDLASQIDGCDGKAVLSKDNKPLSIQKNMEMLTFFAQFSSNLKPIQNKLVSALDAAATTETHWHRTAELTATIERYLLELSLDLPCGIDCAKLSFEGILKSAGIVPVFGSAEPIGEVLAYMELACALLGSRLFVAVNMRSWFSDKEMELFAKDVVSKKLRLLLVDNCDHPRLSCESRWTVDNDLCEF